MDWYVYGHIREDKDQFFYIGIGTQKNFGRAFTKKGRNEIWERITNKTSYKIEILFNELTEEQAKEIEKELIKKYGKIKDGGTLSNITDGGDGTSGLKHTDKTKSIIKEKRKNQIFSEETKKMWSQNRFGNSFAKGKEHSNELKEEKSKRQRGKFGGIIVRKDVEGNVLEFKSIKDAGDSIGVSYKSIWHACVNRNGKLFYGYYWEYKDGERQKKNKETPTKEYLHNEYIVNKKSGEKIGQELNCSGNKIYRLLKKYKIIND